MIKKNIQNLKPYTCARDLYTQGTFLDANENAFGKLNRYPDPQAQELKKALAKYLKMPANYIFCGAGSDEVIDLLFRVLVNYNENIAIVKPTYGMYQVAADINDIKTKTILLNDNYDLDIKAIESQVSKKTKIIIACSPNNPTGNLLSQEKIFKLCKKYKNKIIIIDEAYIEFANQASLVRQVKKYNNLIILRTFSKAWGLAAIRLGYAVANPLIIAALNKSKAPYNLSSITQAIGIQALKNKNKMLRLKKRILQERKKVETALKKMNLKVFKSDANFLVFTIKNASCVQKLLAKKCGIVIRDRSQEPKMKDCLRITVGTANENQVFIKSLKKVYVKS